MSKREVKKYMGTITLRDENGNYSMSKKFFSIKQRKEIQQQFIKLYRLQNKNYIIDILLEDINN